MGLYKQLVPGGINSSSPGLQSIARWYCKYWRFLVQYATNSFSSTGGNSKVGLFMNPDKCEVMTTSAWNDRSDIQVTDWIYMFRRSAMSSQPISMPTTLNCTWQCDRMPAWHSRQSRTVSMTYLAGSWRKDCNSINPRLKQHCLTLEPSDRRYRQPAVSIRWVGDGIPWRHQVASVTLDPALINAVLFLGMIQLVIFCRVTMWSSSGRGSFPISICIVCG